MKWIIASDIHGSAEYCQKMFAAFEREQADKLLLLGDLLYHGPRNDLPKGYSPKDVIRMLNDHSTQLLCVRGNCDTEVDQMVLNFPVLAEYCLLYVAGHTIFASHGHHYNVSSPPPPNPGDILLCGHTHIPACDKYGKFLYVNPGSVSLPKDGSWHGYMTLTEDGMLWKNLDGITQNRYYFNSELLP